jgi:hypothetical protein
MKFLPLLFLLISFHSQASSCSQDAKKFCQGTDPGKGQLARCLSDYTDQLSAACSKELKDFKSKTAKKNPCYEDLAEYCADLPADSKSIEYCLLKNENRLKHVCAADFKKKKPQIIVKDVCAQDVVNTCYDKVSGPDGSITRCLIRNQAKLSKFCQNKVSKAVEKLKKSNPCFDETEKFCPTQVKVIDIQECLEKKMTSLTPNCKKVIQIEKKKSDSNPCYKDLIRHCRRGINPQEQHRCLTINEKELSNSCRQFMAKESEQVKKMVEKCEPDRLKLCAKAPFEDGKVLKCLKQNKSKLSKDCKALIK